MSRLKESESGDLTLFLAEGNPMHKRLLVSLIKDSVLALN